MLLFPDSATSLLTLIRLCECSSNYRGVWYRGSSFNSYKDLSPHWRKSKSRNPVALRGAFDSWWLVLLTCTCSAPALANYQTPSQGILYFL